MEYTRDKALADALLFVASQDRVFSRKNVLTIADDFFAFVNGQPETTTTWRYTYDEGYDGGTTLTAGLHPVNP